MKRRLALFNIMGAAGILLSLVLIVDAVVTFLHVTGHLAKDHLAREAGRYITELEGRACNATAPNDLSLLVAQARTPPADSPHD
ncbi:MAG: hypothetical protein JXQ27_04915 [Acidobacteria bacterium]|nr:hypothetical protein [Acidobacteriota bacterium]